MWNLHRTTDIPRVHEQYFWQNLICRGYTGSKLSNNIECEIFQVLLEEARESYKEDIVMPLRSDNVEDINRNVGTLTDWVNNWRPSWWANWPVKPICCPRGSTPLLPPTPTHDPPTKKNMERRTNILTWIVCFVYWFVLSDEVGFISLTYVCLRL